MKLEKVCRRNVSGNDSFELRSVIHDGLAYRWRQSDRGIAAKNDDLPIECAGPNCHPAGALRREPPGCLRGLELRRAENAEEGALVLAR